MKIDSTYSIKLKLNNARVLKDSVRLYREAVDFLIPVCLEHWGAILQIDSSVKRQSYVEHLVHVTKDNQFPFYAFDSRFYKFPTYLRRSAISEAIGKVSSYKSNLASWQASKAKDKGSAPDIPKAGYCYPCLYRGNCFRRTGVYEAQIKVWIRNTWDWLTVSFRKSDVGYIQKHCLDRKECAPFLRKKGKQWYLAFCFEEYVSLNKTDIWNQRIVAVDLGINSPCVCTVMQSDGTIIGRHFLKLPKEYDSLTRKVDHIRRAQSQGARFTHGLWPLAKGVNRDISVKTAQFIVEAARIYGAHCIVFEYLDTKGKKHGSRKWKLHLWRKAEVQSIVMDKAHRLGIRISRICARNTSRLAFDGSGKILRGNESSKTNGNYSLCEFTSGKVYNCDLNASYNIGSRYFVREILKSLPEEEADFIRAKVPGCNKRSTCTLSTLINLSSVLYDYSYRYTA